MAREVSYCCCCHFLPSSSVDPLTDCLLLVVIPAVAHRFSEKANKIAKRSLLICRTVKQVIINAKKKKEERGSVDEGKEKSNLDEEKFMELNERRVKARKDISNIILKHQD